MISEREFWLCRYFGEFNVQEPNTPICKDMHVYDNKPMMAKNPIHVIEYSAYDKLRADLEMAKDALEIIAKNKFDVGNGVTAIGSHFTLQQKAQEALAKIGERP